MAGPAASRTEIVLVGGGVVGLSLALALDQAGLAVTVLDAAPPPRLDERFDGRAFAIGYSSFRMWRALGVVEALAGAYQRIEDILVTDGRSPIGLAPRGLARPGPSALRLHFDRREVDARADGEALGYMAENHVVRRALAQAIAARPGIDLRTSARVSAVNADAAAASVVLADGETIAADLVIGADGRDSAVRASLGARTIGWPYRQTAIVCTIAHDKPHGGVAHEYFLPAGPFALLPLTDNRTNIVWTERPRAAAALMAMSEADFLAELRQRSGDHLGAVRLAGPRFSYPLSLQIAERMVGPRLAIVGDAAHAIHPIAGQGLNLGLRDVAALAECIADAVRVGLDAADFTALTRYERWRRFDNLSMALATDALTRLFSNDWDRLRWARDLGMAAAGAAGPARRFFMRHAGGATGDLPRLLRGEALAGQGA
jgi:2-octaprenyl-6-methoxyphenol hydroxylase